jgi:hypothetical protein
VLSVCRGNYQQVPLLQLIPMVGVALGELRHVVKRQGTGGQTHA